MSIVAGIDEAGYGPSLGPLVVAASVWRLGGRARPSTLDRLIGLSGRAGGLDIADSKQLYRGRRDFSRLERSALGHVALATGALPLRVGRLLQDALDLDTRELQASPWYAARLERMPLPRCADPADVLEGTRRQAELFADRDLELSALLIAPVLEPRFNHIVSHYGSKAWTVVLATGRLLDEILRRWPQEEITVHLDRQGGRKRYGELLNGFFPLIPIKTVSERAQESVYRIDRPDAPPVSVRVRVKADASRASVALASIAAKATREFFMEALNDWFAERVPGVRPTAGYPTDARRFLRDVAAVGERQAPRARLVRQR